MSTTAPGEGYIDIKDDTLWSGDEELVPIDLSNTTARTFVVYKFGCFITDLLTIHCHHLPVTLLLAEKLPSNSELERNAYRNSFYYDANNRILYLRGERLDNVGEFVLVLVHCLSHIAAGDLRDDNNPVFLKEFHHALAVLCDDLFFARYRRSASLARTLTSRSAGSELETSDLFETVFGESHTESDKASVVDELLDLKLLRGTNKDGVHFTQEALVEQLSKYSNFALGSKLRSHLGDIEEKASQARLQGTDDYVDERLAELVGKQPKERPASRYTQSRGTLLSREVSRQVSRSMAVSRTVTSMPLVRKKAPTQDEKEEDLYKTFIRVSVKHI